MSWYDVRSVAYAGTFKHDTALIRVIDDSWMWADPHTRMLGEVATLMSRANFLEASGRMEKIPADFLPIRYGPSDPDAADHDQMAADEEMAKIERAKAVADELR